MALRNFDRPSKKNRNLNRKSAGTRKSRQSAFRRVLSRQLRFETLEDRRVLAYAVELDAGVLTISQDDAGDTSALDFSLASGTYTFSDAVVAFNAATGDGQANVTSISPNEITVPSSEVTAIIVTLGDGNDIFTFLSFDGPIDPIDVDAGSDLGDEIRIDASFVAEGNVVLSAQTLQFGGDIQTDGGNVDFTGVAEVELTADVAIDTEIGGGTGGDVLFSQLATLTGGGFELAIDVRGTTDDGSVVLPGEMGVTGGALGALTVLAGDGTITIGNDGAGTATINTSGVQFGSNTVLTSDTSFTTNGGDADYSDTIFSSDANGPWSLTINTTTGDANDEGDVFFAGADASGGELLASLTIITDENDGTAGTLTFINDAGSLVSIEIATGDVQLSLAPNVVLEDDVEITTNPATTAGEGHVIFPLIGGTIIGAGQALSINVLGTVDGENVDVGLPGEIGAPGAPIGSLTVTAGLGRIVIGNDGAGATINTSGVQFGSNTVLTADTTITTNGGEADFSDSIFSSLGSPRSLEIDTTDGGAGDEGDVFFAGADDFNGFLLASLTITTDEGDGAPGTLTFTNDSATTVSIEVATGNVDLANAPTVLLDDDVTIRSNPTAAGEGNVLFALLGTTTGAGFELSIDVRGAVAGTDDDGNVDLPGQIGVTGGAIGSLTVLADQGTITIGNDDAVTPTATINTSGVEFGSNTVLTGNTTFTTNGGDADFSDTIFSSDGIGEWTLAIDTTTGDATDEGDVFFAGSDDFGGNFLGGLQIITDEGDGAPGTLFFENDAATDVSITVNGGGSVNLANSPVIVLVDDTSIFTDAAGGATAGGNVLFADLGTIDGGTAGDQSLTIDTSADGGGAHGTIPNGFGTIGDSVELDFLAVTTGGPLSISRDITIDNNIDIEVLDTAATGDDLIVDGTNNAVIESLSGNIVFTAGDDFELQAGATLRAMGGTGTVTINVDQDPGVDADGGTVTIEGVIETDNGAFLNGGDDEDTFNLAPQTTTEFFVDGGAPVLPMLPGDTLNIDLSGTAGASLQITGPGAGVFTFTSAHQDVTYNSIETVNETTATPFDVVVDADASADPLNVANDENPDEFLIIRNGTQLEIHVNGGLVESFDFDSVNSITVNGSDDEDTLTIDHSGGLIAIPDGILFDGNGHPAATGNNEDDLLRLVGDPGITIQRQTHVTTGPDSGIIVFDPSDTAGPGGSVLGTGTLGSDAQFVTYVNLTPIVDSTPSAQLDIYASSAADTIVIEDGPGTDPAFVGVTNTTIVHDGGGATFESHEFANKTLVTVNGMDGEDTFILNNPNPADGLVTLELYGNVFDDTLNADDGESDTFNIQATAAGVDTFAFGQDGDDVFNIFDTNDSLDAILGPVTVDGGDGDDALTITDTGTADSDSETITITGSTIDGITGTPTDPGGLITYTSLDDGTAGTGSLIINGSHNGNTYNVQSTADNLIATTLNTGDGDDIINIGDAINTANGVISPIVLNAGDGDDVLNIDDTGDTDDNVFHMDATTIGGGNFGTPVVAGGIFGAGGILTYSPDLETINVNAGDGDNTFNIDATGVAGTDASVTITDGAGDSTFNIQADALAAGADHTFNGQAGTDTFNVFFAADSDVVANSLVIDGGTPGDSDNRDVVHIDTTADTTGRNLTFTFGGAGSVDVDGLGTTVEITGTETVTYSGGVGNDDNAAVVGTADDDDLTVAPLSLSSALVFIGGNPWNGPADGNFFDALPGVAEGSTGPDLLLNGLATTGLTIDGGGSTNGNRLYVYGTSEDDLVDPNTSDDLFGFGAGVLIPGSTNPLHPASPADANDSIIVTHSLVRFMDDVHAVAPADVRVQVDIFTPSFVQADPENDAAVIVNAGDESNPPETAGVDVADDIVVTLSSTLRFQINGGDPDPATTGIVPPDGDRLTVMTIGDLIVHSDKSDPPNVTISDSNASLPLGFSSIENLQLDAQGGTVTLVGDDNLTTPQTDNFVVVGTGPNAFTLEINGSAPIQFTNVVYLDVIGGEEVDTLDITPWADNTPQGWGIQVTFDEGPPDQTDGGQMDLLIYNTVAANPVSENIVIQPSGLENGELRVTNAVDGSIIVVITYVNNLDIVVNDNDGFDSDTDTLTLRGTNPDTPQVSGNELVTADFSAAGDVANPMVIVGDADNIDPVTGEPFMLYRLRNFTNFDTINFELLGGDDTISVIGRDDGSLTVNIDGGPSVGSDTIVLPGTFNFSDAFTITPGASSDAGTILAERSAATAATTINFTGMEQIHVNAGGGETIDTLTINGTGGPDAFTLTGTGTDEGTAQVNAGPVITFDNLATAMNVNLNGFGGDDSFAITHFAGWRVASVNIDGGPPSASDSVEILGTDEDDEFEYTPTGANSGQIELTSNGLSTSYVLTGIESLLVDALGQDDVDSLFVTTENAEVTLGSPPGSGLIEPVDVDGAPLLAISYRNFELVEIIEGETAVIQGTHEDDTITVSADGIVTVTNLFGFNNSVDVSAFNRLVINALGGNDSITIEASALFAGGIHVIGGEPSGGGDTLNFNGSGLAIEVDLEARNITEAGFGPVSFTGIEIVNIDAAGAGVTVIGTAGNDAFAYTPTDDDAGTLVLADLNAVFNLSGVDTLTLDPVDGIDTVTVHGNSANNEITVDRGLTTTVQVDLLLAIELSAETETLVIRAGLGDDEITVTGTGGPALTVDGGDPTPGDTLNVEAVDVFVTFGGDLSSGVLLGVDIVNFSNIATINLTGDGNGTLTINGTDGNDAINQNGNTVTVNNSAVVNFEEYETLNLNGLSGSDTFNVNPTTLQGVGAFIIDGGDPTAGSDTVVVNAPDDTVYTPTGGDSGSVAVTGAPLVTLAGVEHLTINAEGNPIDLTLEFPIVGAIATLTPGATASSGNITAREFFGSALLGLDYANLSAGSNLIFDTLGALANVELLVLGTSQRDVFNLDSAGTLELVTVLNTFLAPVVQTPGVSDLFLSGLDGDDIFNIAGDHPLTSVTVEGGNPSASDVLNFMGSGVLPLVTVDLEGQSVAQLGSGPVNFSGVEVVNVTANGSVIVQGTPGDDDIAYHPTGLASGRVEVGGLNTVFNLSAVIGLVPLTITGGLTGDDTLTVHGTTAGEVIEVDGTSVEVGLLLPVVYAGFDALTVNGHEGSDTFNVTPADIPIRINGGDPIGVNVGGGDTLNIVAAAPVFFFPGPHDDEGAFVVAGFEPVSFTEIEIFGVVGPPGPGPGPGPIPGPLVLFGTNGDDVITIIARDVSTHPGADGIQDFTVSINDGPEFLFLNVPQLWIDGLAGDDRFVLRTPAPNNADWDVEVLLVGGPGEDTLTLETPGDEGEIVTFTPTGPETGTILVESTGGGLIADITLSDESFLPLLVPPLVPPLPIMISPIIGGNGGFIQVLYDGQGDDDELTVVSTPGDDTIVHTPGEAFDEGRFRVNNFLALDYRNLGAGATLTVDGDDGDTLVVDGTQNNDIFTVATGTGAITVNDRLVIDPTDVGNLTLRGLDGDDTFNIPGGHGYTSISVEGGNPSSGSDFVHLTGTPGVVVDNVLIRPSAANPTEQEVEGLGGLITLAGVEVIRYTGVGGDDNLTVQTGSANDTARLDGGLDFDELTSSSLPRIQFDVVNDFTLDVFTGIDTATINLSFIQGANNYFVNASVSDTVIFEGSGDNDLWTLTNPVGANGLTIVDNTPAHSGAAVTVIGIPQDIRLHTLGGDDVVTIDVSVDGPIPLPITFDGGAGRDTLIVQGTPPAGAFDSVVYSPGPAVDQGRLEYFDGVGRAMLIDFRNLEPVVDLVPAVTLTVNGTNADNAINYTQGSVATNGLVSVDGFETIEFSNKTNLVINALAGNDTINLNNPTTPTDLTSITINGGDPTDGDILVVNGRVGVVDSLRHNPTGQGAGSVVNDAGGQPDVNFTGITALRLVVQQADGDDIRLEGTIGDDRIQFFHGDTADSGIFRGTMDMNNATGAGPFTLTETIYFGLDAAANDADVNFFNPGGVDTFEFNGTFADDTIAVLIGDGGGVEFRNEINGTVVSRIEVFNIASAVVRGGDGNDTFNHVGSVAIPVSYEGGGPSLGDVLNFTGSADVIVDLDAQTVEQVGGGVVSLSGIEVLNVTAGASAITVVGTAVGDDIRVTPTSANSASIVLAGLNLVVNTTNTGTLTVDAGGGNDTVTVHGTSAADVINVVRGATTTVTVVGLKTVSLPAASTAALVVSAGLGNDTINVSGTAGPASLTVDGGLPTVSDTLTITNSAVGTTTVTPGSTPDSGVVTHSVDGAVSFIGIELITLTADAAAGDVLVMQGTHDDDTIALQHLGGANRVWINDRGVVSFANYETVTLQGRFGSDSFSVHPVGLVGVSTINVQGGDPTASDTLTVNGSSGADDITYTPTSFDSGSVAIVGSATVNFSTTEHLTINGLGGGDNLTINTFNIDGTQVLTPGSSFDSGRVDFRDGGFNTNNAVSLDFLGLDVGGSLTFADIDPVLGTTGRFDNLIYRGTDLDDTFSVDAVGQVLLNTQIPVNTPSIINLTLAGLDGDDTFNIAGNHELPAIRVEGGNSSSSDVLNFTGSGIGLVTVDFGAQTVTEAGSGSVTYSGVERINVDAGQLGLTVVATNDDDDVTVNVFGASSGTVQIGSTAQQDGQAQQPLTPPLVHYTNTDGNPLHVDLGAGHDTLIVVGNALPQEFVVDGPGQTVTIDDNLDGVNNGIVTYENTESLAVYGLEGSDTFIVTGGPIPIFIDGGDPIGTLPGDTLIVTNATAFFPGPQVDEGGFLTTGGPDGIVSFDHIEFVVVAPDPNGNGNGNGNGCPFIIFGTNADDDITVIARDGSTHPGADGVQDFTVSVNEGPEILFLNVPHLVIDALAGDDDIVIRGPAPNQAAWDMTFTVIGGPPAGITGDQGDVLMVETTGLVDVVYTPTGSDTGTMVITNTLGLVADITIQSEAFVQPAGCPPVPPPTIGGNGGIETLIYDGGGFGDSLTIIGTDGDDIIVHTPHAGIDEGHVRVNTLLGINYQNLGIAAGASLTIDGDGGIDTLVVDGTGQSDTFTVAATTGAVTLANSHGTRLAVQQANIQHLVLNGLEGDDTFIINAPQPYNSITTNGGGPGASDILIVNGAAGVDEDFTVNPGFGNGNGEVQVNALLIPYTGIEHILLDANDGDNDNDTLTVNDDFADNLWTVNAGPIFGDRIQIDSRESIDYVDFTAVTLVNQFGADHFVIHPTHLIGTAALTVLADGGAVRDDVVTIMGTEADDVITSNADTITVNDGVPVTIGNNGAGFAEVQVLALGGDDHITLSLELPGVRKFVDGGAGNDFIDMSGTDNAIIFGGDGDDFIIGTPFADFIDGGRGNDIIFGGGGNDVIYGGEGNDIIIGGPGSDQMFGGPGDDTFIWNPGDGSDLIEGGTGNNVLQVVGEAGADTFTMSADGTRLRFERDNGVLDVLDVANVQQVDTNVTISFTNQLTGDQEVPAVATAATGWQFLTFDSTTNTFDLDVFIQGIALADITGYHIHVGASGVNGPVIVDLEVFADWFVEGGGLRLRIRDAEFPAANIADLLAGNTYVNVHTTAFPPGEIRGQLDPLAAAQALGGADTFEIFDLHQTDVKVVNLGLGTLPDGAIDDVRVHGRATDDNIMVSLATFYDETEYVQVTGLRYDVNIWNSVQAEGDRLTVLGNEGNDRITVEAGVAERINLTLEGGPGDDVLDASAVEAGFSVTLDGGAGDDLLIGGAGDDTFFGGDGDDTFIGGGGNNTFDGGPGFDTILVEGTPANDTIDVFQSGAAALTYTVNGVTSNETLVAGTVQEVRVEAGAGADLIRVRTADALFDQVGMALRMTVNGGTASGAGDRLVVVDDGTDDLTLYRKGFVETEGTVEIGPANLQPFLVVFSGIERVQFVDENGVAINQSATTGPRLAVFHPDPFEYNDDRLVATHLGANQTVNVGATIDPGPIMTPFAVPSDQDWYRVVAEVTGTLDFQVYFTQIGPLASGRPGLPNNGNLDIEVRDAAGNVIAGFGANTATDNERRRIPAVAGQTYYLRVFGAGNAINAYNMTVINTAPPVPFDIELQDTPVGDPPPANSDTGRSQFDNITRDNTPTLFFRLDDGIFRFDVQGNDPGAGGFPNNPPTGVAIPIPFQTALQPGYRIAIFDEGPTPGQAAQNPQIPLGFATAVAGSPGLYTFTTPVLSDGSHFLSARVQMVDPSNPTQTGFGERSASLEIIVDTVPPNVSFGQPGVVGDGLISDTGVSPPNQHTIADRITADTRPTFWGRAEANAIIRLFADVNGNGVFDPGVDVFIGQTTATPLDGTNQEPNGYWEIRSVIDLNDPAFFPNADGLRTIFVTATDVAGNVNAPGDVFGVDADEILQIFVDTQGPVITDVHITDDPLFPLFEPKPADGPTPLVFSLSIDFRDAPNRAPGFLFEALKEDIASNPGHYLLVGDFNGIIPIQQVIVTNHPVQAGQAATATVELVFFEPLPDDRFTLTVFDSIRDLAGNRLDGESNAMEPVGNALITFPTGDGISGGDFVARFTVDSRPEIGVWAAGSIWVDTNGNFIWDNDNLDFVNRDITYAMGFASDNIFAGRFWHPAFGPPNGFDKIAAYGFDNGSFRWLIDLDDDGTPDAPASGLDPNGLNGIPIAGNFDGNPLTDQVGVFDGVRWRFDTDNDFRLNPESTITGSLRGYPFVGDFDGDGLTDIGTYLDGVFHIDLSSVGPTVIGTLPGINGVADVSFRFGDSFLSNRVRPVAADMNGDGFTDLGLWVPDRAGLTPNENGEWYFLVSDGFNGGGSVLDRIEVDPVRGDNVIHFTPVPFGNDIYANFGNQFAKPIVGNFDPPAALEGPEPEGNLHTNLNNPLDVNGDGVVSPVDAMLVINRLNSEGAGRLYGSAGPDGPFLDTNMDGFVSPSDVAMIINYLNSLSASAEHAEGEGTAEPAELIVSAPPVELGGSLEVSLAASSSLVNDDPAPADAIPILADRLVQPLVPERRESDDERLAAWETELAESPRVGLSSQSAHDAALAATLDDDWDDLAEDVRRTRREESAVDEFFEELGSE